VSQGKPEPDDGERYEEDERLDGVRPGAPKMPGDQGTDADDERELTCRVP
jgi:hypothetical protein